MSNVTKMCVEEKCIVPQNSKIEKVENEIVLKAKSGDDEALKYIFDNFKGYIRYLSNKFYLAGADSDDLVQEGMIGLFKAINDFSKNENTAFSSFAVVCIENQIKTAIKKANRKKHQPLNSSVSLSIAMYENEGKQLAELLGEDSSNPEKIYINNETYSNMNKLIYNSLTKLELQILLLYNKGLSYKEISQISGRTVKSIDNAVQRIRKKVKKVRQGIDGI